VFQTPTVPFATCNSDVKTKAQRSDSYQPRDMGDHSNEWMRIAVVSMPGMGDFWIVRRILDVGVSVRVVLDCDMS
jgi:hypothetical protein